jgi:hypothetical protein
VKRTPELPKKISRRRTDGRTENSQKISLFQIFLKIECSRVPIHFKVAAAGAQHPLRENFPGLIILLFKDNSNKFYFSDGTKKKINSIYNAFNHTFKWLKTRKKEHLNAFLRSETVTPQTRKTASCVS